MNRRGFLKFVAAALPAATVSAELLEYLAPRPTIFLPPRSGWAMPPHYGNVSFEELQAITCKYFLPHVIATVHDNSPLLRALLANSRR